MKSIPAMVALPAAAAFLIELPFYLLPGFGIGSLRNPALLAASCVLPYLVYSVPTGEFRFPAFAFLCLLALVLSYWYRLLPPKPIFDILFLALAASVLLFKVFDRIYLSPIPKVPLSTLGHLMLIRTCAIAVLAMRGGVDAEFRFIPTLQEILAALKWFALMLPVVTAALWATGLWTLKPHPNLRTAIPQFLGILWVVALSEDFFFWGLLSEWLTKWTGQGTLALIVMSILFGAVHLTFNHIFPNWRFAIVAALLGLFCGLCWRQTRSVQAAMVTHALGATVYRVFFQ
jgi:membrane protease YdiL (CAAX protease family)